MTPARAERITVTTPLFVSRAQHSHVTEREAAHRWPNGQWDNAAWEDCTWMSGVELARLCHNSRIPATHYEGERLRQVAHVNPTGGSNSDDLVRGFALRYGWTPTTTRGFAATWSALSHGRAAMVQGVMGVFSRSHRLRRWDVNFNGQHAVLCVRADFTDRVWWCDPLAPEGSGYQGEWVSKAELKLYVDAIQAAGGRTVYGNVRQNYVCTVADGARLYVRQDLKPTSQDILIHPGPRTMPYHFQVTAAAKKVEYVNAKGVHTGKFYFVKNAAVSSIWATG
jgi:hypothetical protein